jgi:hypothetical protein
MASAPAMLLEWAPLTSTLGCTLRPQVIIIGTSHRLQAGHEEHSAEAQLAFQNLVEATAKKYRVKFIAEEMTEDILSAFGVSETISKRVATRKNLAHAYIDLTSEERHCLQTDRLSLYEIRSDAKLSEPQFSALERLVGELRECAWVVRVLAANVWPTLFICGSNHATRVADLFDRVGKLALLEEHDYAP